MSNLPPGVTGQERYFSEEPDATCACGMELCERAVDLDASKCCNCAGRAGCPICFPEKNDDE